MDITFDENRQIIHIKNQEISYVIEIVNRKYPVHRYFGRALRQYRGMGIPRYFKRGYATEHNICAEHAAFDGVPFEYPIRGNGDFRIPAISVIRDDGIAFADPVFSSFSIKNGSPDIPGLPAVTVPEESAKSLEIICEDRTAGLRVILSYTVVAETGIMLRHQRIENIGERTLWIQNAQSLSLKLPAGPYDFLSMYGTHAKEANRDRFRLHHGIQRIESVRGSSSPQHQPFFALISPDTSEEKGVVFAFHLVYSGNFLAQVEVDTHETTRVLLGIHPDWFDWKLEPGSSFQTPEAVMFYTDQGLNHLSQTCHRLYQKRLARGYWRDKVRPILINNWEATYFNFTEDKLVEIASKAKECGVELFVLDDGWFGARRNDRAGLGDWTPALSLLPGGIKGIADKIEALGMKFGLWFEPEMVNMDSDLYRAHPDWILSTPNRSASHGRYQHVLDFSRPEVVDCIYQMMKRILSEAKISYIKWDMNRSITECYSAALPADRQGEVFHRYILGVYDLYERLTSQFPEILFESCASGGARFDPGMLYYAPQAWTSDDTDAVERLKIQYGSSYCYPLSSMGSHVSVCPNHQLNRTTPLYTRANVAYFGTFGYELDLNKLTEEEQEEVKEQIKFMKQYRELFQFGTFYRLSSPFENNVTAWMVVSEDKKEAIVGWYRILNVVNEAFHRIPLKGLDPELCYHSLADGNSYYGDELMYAGLITSDSSAGETTPETEHSCDFDSRLYILKA